MADDVEYAGFWIRVVAALIDTVLVAMIFVPLTIHLYGSEYVQAITAAMQSPGEIPSLPPVPHLSGLTSFLINFSPVVAVIVFWVYRGATPGKMIVSAKIVDATTGANPSVGQSIGRYFAYFLSIFPFCLGLIWVAFDPRKQGWHDKLAHTVVIRTRRAAPSAAQLHAEHRPGT
jgi:uncharacterized RDD family membrane protein YckC